MNLDEIFKMVLEILILAGFIYVVLRFLLETRGTGVIRGLTILGGGAFVLFFVLIETLGLYHLGRARSLLFGLCVGVGAHLLFHTFFDTADVRLIPDILDGAWLAGNSIICLGLAAFLARK